MAHGKRWDVLDLILPRAKMIAFDNAKECGVKEVFREDFAIVVKTEMSTRRVFLDEVSPLFAKDDYAGIDRLIRRAVGMAA